MKNYTIIGGVNGFCAGGGVPQRGASPRRQPPPSVAHGAAAIPGHIRQLYGGAQP